MQLIEGKHSSNSIRWVKIGENPLTWYLTPGTDKDGGHDSFAVLESAWDDKSWTTYCLFMYNISRQASWIKGNTKGVLSLAVYCTIGKPKSRITQADVDAAVTVSNLMEIRSLGSVFGPATGLPESRVPVTCDGACPTCPECFSVGLPAFARVIQFFHRSLSYPFGGWGSESKNDLSQEAKEKLVDIYIQKCAAITEALNKELDLVKKKGL